MNPTRRRLGGVVAATPLLLSCCAFLWAAPLASQAPGAPPAEIVAEVTRLDSIWLNAYVTADVEAVRPIVADDFQGQLHTQLVDRDELLERVAGTTGVEAMPLDRLVVHVHDDVAVAHGSRRRVSSDANGARVESRFVYTDVYVWRDGRWQCITGQSAPADEGG